MKHFFHIMGPEFLSEHFEISFWRSGNARYCSRAGKASQFSIKSVLSIWTSDSIECEHFRRKFSIEELLCAWQLNDLLHFWICSMCATFAISEFQGQIRCIQLYLYFLYIPCLLEQSDVYYRSSSHVNGDYLMLGGYYHFKYTYPFMFNLYIAIYYCQISHFTLVVHWKLILHSICEQLIPINILN